jgi:hypothetical protein
MGTPEMMDKMNKGPIGYVTIVRNGMIAMGPMMAKSAVANIVIALFVAYVASNTLMAGAEYLAVFRITATVSFMAYAFGTIPDSIWFGRPWKSWFLGAGDALMYALVTGGVFGWLWPS